MDSITSGGDYYLLANDFPSYIEAQVLRRFPSPTHAYGICRLKFWPCSVHAFLPGMPSSAMQLNQQPSKRVPQSCLPDPRSMYVELRSVHISACSDSDQARVGWCLDRHVMRTPMSLPHVRRSGWMRRTRIAPGGRACPSCPQLAAASSPLTGLSWSMRGISGRPSPAMSLRPWSEAASCGFMCTQVAACMLYPCAQPCHVPALME